MSVPGRGFRNGLGAHAGGLRVVGALRRLPGEQGWDDEAATLLDLLGGDDAAYELVENLDTIAGTWRALPEVERKVVERLNDRFFCSDSGRLRFCSCTGSSCLTVTRRGSFRVVR